jgi:hypothetical protein
MPRYRWGFRVERAGLSGGGDDRVMASAPEKYRATPQRLPISVFETRLATDREESGSPDCSMMPLHDGLSLSDFG